ncbi:MAG: glycosyltransferase family 2 protein [Candidatus Aminicenantes bacterium]|nr:glycosyltransferase family 2 protein [Candidatus Aminicenantes bacterium]
MNNKVELSIVIVNYNSGKYLYDTIVSVLEQDLNINFEIIVIDNHSIDNSIIPVKEKFPAVKIIELNENKGFAYANNVGADNSNGKYILILNNDTKILENSIESLLSEIKENPKYGILSPVLYYSDGSPQISFGRDPGIITEFFTKYFSVVFFKLELFFSKGKFEKDADWISGACFLIHSTLYKNLSGFDEKFFLYYEDADLGKRVREKGYLNHITSKSKIIHFLGKSTGPVYSGLLPVIKKGHLYYYKKHNNKASFNFLKSYLIIKYYLRLSFTMLSGKKEKSLSIKETLSAIKRVKYEKNNT